MASSSPKKTQTPATARRPSDKPALSAAADTNSTPSKSPTRMAAGSAAATATATATGTAMNGINRARSVRQGTPSAVRASARKPADATEADAKAEMNARLEELREQLRLADERAADQQKQTVVLQIKLDEALKEQGILDERVHEQIEKIEDLENDKRESLRARRELEQIYETERVQTMKDREESSAREEALQSMIHRIKDSFAHREMRAGLEDEGRPALSRSSSFRRSAGGARSGDQSPNPGGAQFAPPSSISRSDSRSSSKLVMQKDKIIEDLRLELAELQIKLVQMENMGGGRMQELEKSMYDIKVQNARLMEENESFQLMITEKTLNGDFAQSEFLRPASSRRSVASRPVSRQNEDDSTPTVAKVHSLADELGAQVDDLDVSVVRTHTDDNARRYHVEIDGLKEQNHLLTLYINNIISRLLQHEQFEQILDKSPDLMSGPNEANRKAMINKDLPPSPPANEVSSASAARGSEAQQQQTQPVGFLQRARSVVNRARPQSQIFEQPTLQPQVPSRHENPSTAPQIPLGRSSSIKTGHRRANSEWAAGVVSNMYKGPMPGSGAPLSPGLGSPRERSSFFSQALPMSPAGSRMPSSGSVPTIAEGQSNKENAPGSTIRDSKFSSHRSSVQSNSGMSDPSNAEGGAELSAPTSPPHSISSSGDRDSKQSGAIMMGSKVRPLRLVQEAAGEREKKTAATAASNNSNRASWFGWMNKGASSAPPTLTRNMSSGEGPGGHS